MARKPLILVTEPDGYSAQALARYRAVGRVVLLPTVPTRRRARVFSGTRVLVVRLGYQIDKEWFEKMPDLGLIVTPTTGLNHIDLSLALRRGVRVLSLRGHTNFLKKIPSTAEETVGLIIALTRNIPWAFEDVKRGKWRRDFWKGHQLKGKTLGVLGCGRLGRMVARYARAFGMRVIGADPHVSALALRRHGIHKVSMATLFKKSDLVSVHVLLDPKTRHLVRASHLRQMKPGAYLINTARGEIVETKALVRALRNKWIAGAAVDVLENESGDGTHLRRDPLVQYAKTHTNLLVLPHIGGATQEAMQATEEFMAGLAKKHIQTL